MPLVLQEDYNNDMFRIYVGHLQVVTRLSDQLYRNAWSVLGESWGREGSGSRSHYNSGYHGPGVSGGIPLIVCSAHFSKWVLLLY